MSVGFLRLDKGLLYPLLQRSNLYTCDTLPLVMYTESREFSSSLLKKEYSSYIWYKLIVGNIPRIVKDVFLSSRSF